MRMEVTTIPNLEDQRCWIWLTDDDEPSWVRANVLAAWFADGEPTVLVAEFETGITWTITLPSGDIAFCDEQPETDTAAAAE